MHNRRNHISARLADDYCVPICRGPRAAGLLYQRYSQPLLKYLNLRSSKEWPACKAIPCSSSDLRSLVFNTDTVSALPILGNGEGVERSTNLARIIFEAATELEFAERQVASFVPTD